MARTLLALAVATAAAASGTTAQDPAVESGLVERVAVDLVQIPVVVTDRDGRPVRDLTVADFVVEQDGKRVELAHCTPMFGRAPEAPPSAAPGSGDALPWTSTGEPAPLAREDTLHLVILVDEMNLNPGTRNQVFRQLGDLIRDSLDPAVPVMLAANGPRLVVHQPFTTDRAALTSRMADLSEDFAVGLFDPESQDSRRRDLDLSLDVLRDCLRNPVCEPRGNAGSTASAIRAYSLAAVAQTERTLANVRHFFSSLTFLPGRKAVLWVSDGFPLNPGQDEFRRMQDIVRTEASRLRAELSAAGGTGGFEGQIASSQLARRLADLEDVADGYSLENVTVNVEPAIVRVAEVANASGIQVYTLQAKALSSGADATRSASASDLTDTPSLGALADGNLRATLVRLASETGGIMLQGSLKSERMLDTIVRDATDHYLLGFVTDKATDGAHHAIEVKVRGRRKLDIRHPQGYLGRTLQMQRAERTLAALYHGYGKNPAAIWLELGYTLPEEPGDDERGVPVSMTLHVPVEAVRFANGPDGVPTAELSVFVASKDRKGRVVNLVELPVPISIPADRLTEAAGETLTVPLRIRARAGRNDVAVGVWTAPDAEPSFTRTLFQPDTDG